ARIELQGNRVGCEVERHKCRISDPHGAENGSGETGRCGRGREITMNIDPNDPKLTAFALGELEEAERAQVEATLKNSPAALRAVDDVQNAARLLTDGLANEPRLSLPENMT